MDRPLLKQERLEHRVETTPSAGPLGSTTFVLSVVVGEHMYRREREVSDAERMLEPAAAVRRAWRDLHRGLSDDVLDAYFEPPAER